MDEVKTRQDEKLTEAIEEMKKAEKVYEKVKGETEELISSTNETPPG